MLEWEIGPSLRTVRGVIEVNALGGEKKQYEVVIDPAKLAAHRVTLGRVLDALTRNNANVGGGYIERGAEQFTIPPRRASSARSTTSRRWSSRRTPTARRCSFETSPACPA